MKAELAIIGRVHSVLKKLDDCPRQESESAPPATIEVLPDFIKAIDGVKKGDHLVLLTWLNQADRSTLVTHPRNDARTKLTGVFLTRSPDRPNPIGMHRVTVRNVVGPGHFEVECLEVLDQTPVIDIKVDIDV